MSKFCGSLGYGLGAAVGAQLGATERPVVLSIGVTNKSKQHAVIRRLTAPWVRASASAAMRTEPRRAVASNARRSSKDGISDRFIGDTISPITAKKYRFSSIGERS